MQVVEKMLINMVHFQTLSSNEIMQRLLEATELLTKCWRYQWFKSFVFSGFLSYSILYILNIRHQNSPKQCKRFGGIFWLHFTQQVGPDPEVGGCAPVGARFERRARGRWLASTVSCGRTALPEPEPNHSSIALMINLSCATRPESPSGLAALWQTS